MSALAEAPAVGELEAAQATNFLREFDGDGWHNLVAIDPAGNGGPIGRTVAPGSWRDVEAFVSEWNGRRNLYFSVNEPAADAPHSKLSARDIGALRAAHVDIDPPAGTDLESARGAALETLARAAVQPTFVIDSGGGMQAFWTLAKKLPADKQAEVRSLNAALCEGLGGDPAVVDVARIMRLPFTLNLPGATKLKKHPGRQPRISSIVSANGPRYGIGELQAGFPTAARPASAKRAAGATRPLAAVAKAMRHIPNADADYAEWIQVAYALWAAVGPELGEGLALFHEWSARSEEKYIPEKTEAAWRGIKSVDYLDGEALFALAKLHGWPAAADEFETVEIDDGPVQSAKKPYLLSYADMQALAEPDWLVDGILQQRTAALMFGKSNTFKSFLAIDIALCVATGKAWHGRKVSGAGRVAYVATEGAIGVARQRIPGWFAFHEVEAERRGNIFLRAAAVEMDDAGAVSQLIAALAAEGGFSLVVLDIFGGTMRGTEVEDTTARAWVKGVQRLVAAGITVLTVAHTGWGDQTRARMHTHFWGSFDTRLKVDGDKDRRTSVLSIERHKDADSLGTYPFRLEGAHGTLVPVLDETARTPNTAGLPPAARKALAALEAALEEAGAVKFDEGWPACRVTPLSAWRTACDSVPLSDGTSESAHRTAFNRARTTLVERGIVREHLDFFWQSADE